MTFQHSMTQETCSLVQVGLSCFRGFMLSSPCAKCTFYILLSPRRSIKPVSGHK